MAALLIGAFSFAATAQTPAPEVIPPNFDHLTTGFPLTGAHKQAKCETCHDKGIFKGTPKPCTACHGYGARISSILIPMTHPQTQLACEVCHTTVTFTGAKWNHIEAQPGQCSGCHNGTTAPGKSANHVPTTQSCDACHRTTAWKPAGFDHTGIVVGCSTCHNGSAATGKTNGHIPTSAPCESCHTSTVTFATWTMNHTGIANGCVTCHGGQFAGVMSKTSNHVATTAPCENCHTSTTTFKTATFDHTGVVNGCSNCHNGASARGKTATHIPTVQPCEICHSSTQVFSTWSMNHSQIVTGCAQCHGGQFPLVTSKPANHPVTNAPCENCHNNFTTWKGATFDHAGITGQCANCHNGSQAVGMPGGHVPTSQPCETCHSVTNFSTWSGTKMNHVGITSSCASCHGSGSSFFGVAVKTPPGNHIPTGGATCESCHAATNFATFAGTPMNHAAVVSITCSSCHETGMSFAGVSVVTRPTAAKDPAHPTSGDCGMCHTATTFTTAKGMPANHLPTSQPCTLCHSNANDFSLSVMSHAGISSNCAQCHGTGSSFANVVPKQMPANHVPTNQPCESCHSVTNFATFGGTKMSHAGINGGCASCHSTGQSFFGVTVKTPPANHIPTSQPCEVCHSVSNFTTFGGATMSHAGISSGCAMCHATGLSFFGVTVKTAPANHIPTTQACESCHSVSNFATFTGTSMNHAGISSGCATCHATAVGSSFFGVTVKSPPGTHIPFGNATCESCHAPGNFAAFSGTAMNHAAVTAITCSTCHETGMSFFGVTIVVRPTLTQDPNHPQAGVGGDCSACHSTSSFTAGIGKPANHIPTTQACTLCHSNSSNYAVSTMNHAGITSGCATCHGTGLSFANIVPKEEPANHIPTSQPCEVCHSVTNFTNFAGTSMNHAGITSNCAQCHASTSPAYFGVTVKQPPATHIPFGTATCESCHSASTFTSFAGTAMNHAAVTSITCQTCHETGKSFFGVTIVTRPTLTQDPNHPQAGTGGDCGACHTTTSFTSGVGKPSNHLPTTQACTLCHSNSSNYAVGTMNHAGITSNCSQCHGTTQLSFANSMPKAEPANHIPTSQACEVCHSASNFTTFAGTSMNHAGITSGCATCHATAVGSTFFGVTVKAPPATHIPFGSATCESCHSASNFTSFSGTPMNHAVVTSMTCASCHETGKSFFGVTIVVRPTLAQDPNHPQAGTGGDCSACHTTTSFTTGIAKPANHIPTTQACTLCHSNSSNYAVATMNHAGITSNCSQCHGTTQLSFANSMPKAEPANHIPTSQACEVCHSASNFTTFAGTSMNHAGITSGCATCHATGSSFFGVTVKVPPANHIPTSQPCEVCHSASNFTTFSGTAMNHAGITSNCAQCHASTSPAYFGVTVKQPPATHIPFGSATCESCHSASNFTSFAGTAMNHAVVTSMTCATCHETGKTFYGVTIVTRPTTAQDPNHPTTGDCAGCHTTTSFNTAGVKPANHIPTTQACALCHLTAGNYTTATMNHQGITSGCATCHGKGLTFANIVPMEPPTTHVPYNNIACEGCHSATAFTTFSGTLVNHTTVASFTCITCHEYGMTWYGTTQQDRPSTNHHPGLDCQPCHHPGNGWGGKKAVVNVHLGIRPGSCLTCHNGKTASSKSAQHIITTLSCDACHRTTAWVPAAFTHVAAAPGSCMTCHNRIRTKSMPAAHFVTTRSCDTCHRTTSWLPVIYRHLSPAYRDHGSSVTCVGCHKANTEVAIWTSPAFKPDCAGCHANRFLPQMHPKVGGGLNTVVDLRDCAGACHLGTVRGKAPQNPGFRHRPTDGSF